MNPLIYIDACLWSSLHFVILNIPPSRLPLFPLLAGLVWLATLASLLLSWVAHGMPRYPGQNYPIAYVFIGWIYLFLVCDLLCWKSGSGPANWPANWRRH